MQLLPLDRLGAIERDGSVAFGILLPWVRAADGNRLRVKVIHEDDQFLQAVQPREFPLTQSTIAPWGEYWSATVAIAADGDGSAWGRPGRYVYRYCLTAPDGREIDWCIDPCAREFGTGKLSAFTLGYEPYRWSAGERAWRVPAAGDQAFYELNLAEFAGDLDQAIGRLGYLADLGVNVLSVMPVTNVDNQVDWGYLPIGYFGVDERFGRRRDFQRFVDAAHARGLAVVVDAVYGHTADAFGYQYIYSQLGYAENPFMGPFARDYFGCSTDFRRELTRDFFHTVNQHWLECYHVDGFRYDCVPNYWDPASDDGYTGLVQATYAEVALRAAAGGVRLARAAGGGSSASSAASAAGDAWQRFAGSPLRLIQCAEQLEDPVGILERTCSTSTWQNLTLDAAKAVARGDSGRLADLGLRLGLEGFPVVATSGGITLPRTALQYIENHDHERFVCNFGLLDRDGNELFREGDRDRDWFRVQPYLIALLMAKGTPMLWQGQEFAENYFLPEGGMGRVRLERPLRWDYFYDAIGKRTVRLVRDLLRIRRDNPHVREGEFFFFNDHDRYQSKGLLLFARYQGSSYSLVAVNTTDQEQWAPFWFPIAGDYREELHGAEDPSLGLVAVPAYQEYWLRVPASYGRIWTI